jgi:tRNA A64-2'-O-ribosylphosphate transferase
MLLSLDREELEEGLERAKSQPASELVSGLSGLDVGEKSEGTNTPASTSRLVGAPHPTSRLALDIGPPVSPVDPWHAIPTEDSITIYLVSIPKAQLYPDVIYSNPTTKGSMGVAIPSPKSDSWAYKDSLMKLVSALKIYEKSNMILKAGTTDHLDLIIKATAEDKDISQTLCDMPSPEDAVSSRKSVIPVALLLLCAFSLDNDLPRTGNGTEEGLSKGSISSVLLSLVALWPDSNPPRAALKRVNEVLLGRS